MSLGLPARIEAKISPEPNSGCWLWTGGLRDKREGYGGVGYQGKTYRAHKLVYLLLIGPVPEGFDLDHICRIRCCCNPAHLEPVTRKINIYRGAGLAPKHRAKTHCIRGHEFTAENTQLYHYPKGGFQRLCKQCRAMHSLAHYRRKQAR